MKIANLLQPSEAPIPSSPPAGITMRETRPPTLPSAVAENQLSSTESQAMDISNSPMGKTANIQPVQARSRIPGLVDRTNRE